jgi:hypothetical protein
VVSRWFVFACLVLAVVAIVSLTAIDKRDEQACSQQRVRLFLEDYDESAVRCSSDGFLAW